MRYYDYGNSELMSHKQSDKVKWIFTGIAFVLVFVLMAGLCMQIFAKNELKPSNWGKDFDTEFVATANNVVIPESVEGEGIMLLSTAIPIASYSEYDVSPQAETAYTLTATVTPEYATDKRVNFSIAWADSSTEWANGKSIRDYLTLSQTADGSLTAVLSCNEAFGEQAIITVTSRSNPGASATCTVDYKQKYIGTATSLYDANPTDGRVNFSTPATGGSITTPLPNTNGYSGSFMSSYFKLEKSTVYTIPLTGNAHIEYYVKPTTAFADAIEMHNKMIESSYMTVYTEDWKCVTSLTVDLEQTTHSFGFTSKYEMSNYISRYLSFLVYEVATGSSGYFSNQYVYFAGAVNSVNANPLTKEPHFQIKIVTHIEEETYEAITTVTCNSVTFPATGVGMDSQVVF